MLIGIFGADTAIYDDTGVMSEHLEALSSYRCHKYETIKPEGGKKLSLMASHLIDVGLKAYGLREKDMKYGHSDHGRPYFTDREDILFSISHSGSRVVVCMNGPYDNVISDDRSRVEFSLRDIPVPEGRTISGIGIDTERIGLYSDRTEGIIRRFYHPDEARYIFGINDVNDRAGEFTRIWTLKESYIKALGTGLAEGMETFAVLPADDSVSFINVKSDSHDNICHFEHIDSPEDYKTSWCAVYE